MKLNFNNLSIRIKVILLIAFILSITLIISGFLFFLYDRSEFKTKSLRDLTIIAKIVGNNTTAAITFNDSRAATEYLNSLSAETQIKYAVIFTKDGRKFAEYLKDSNLNKPEVNLEKIPEDGYLFKNNSLTIYSDIVLDKEKIGVVYLYSTLEEYNIRFNSFLSFLFILLAYTILSVIVFSLPLQKYISKPIIRLAELMENITQHRDFSARMKKTSEDEIGKLYDGFNHMLTEVENSNKALEIAKDNAVKSDVLKSVFLSNMSHEIRTPLNAVIGFTDILINKPLPEKDKADYLSYINASSKLLLQLINDIIDFAKIESGQLKINITETPVNFVLGELYSSYKNQIKIKDKTKIDLRLQTHNNNLIIKTDQFRLKQILNNLISNAIKFTDVGYIEFGYDMKDRNELVFYVKDTGIGLEKDELEGLFKRYSQVRVSDTVNYGGSGLGLSISKNLVELLGGKMWAESEPLKGSTFFFKLPIII